MRKIVVSEFISLDGVFEAPHTWHFPYISDDMGAFNVEQVLKTDVMLMGRNTYQEFASFWPQTTNNEYGIGDKLNNSPKYVVSKTLKTADWNNTTILRSVDNVRKLKEDGNGILGMTGSGALTLSLMEAHLIDQLDLLIHPIVVGTGKRLFPEGGSNYGLKLLESRVFQSGVVLMRYVPA